MAKVRTPAARLPGLVSVRRGRNRRPRARESDLARQPAVDMVVGPQSYHRLPEMLARTGLLGMIGKAERGPAPIGYYVLAVVITVFVMLGLVMVLSA